MVVAERSFALPDLVNKLEEGKERRRSRRREFSFTFSLVRVLFEFGL